MKVVLLLLTTWITFSVSAQVDRLGNPIFNNILISEEKIDNFELTAGYYTIDSNIAFKGSSVYVSDNPTLEEYLAFARDLPSYFFIIHKGSHVIAMIMLMQKNEGTKTTVFYNILNPNNQKSIEARCGVWGDITEMRALELIKLKVDPDADIISLPNNGKGLHYNKIAYRIQPYDKLKEEIVEIAKELAASPVEEDVKDPIANIKAETKEGKLNFEKVLETEKQELFLVDKVAYNKNDFAKFLWGQAVKRIGIKNSKKALKLWIEIHGRKLTKTEAKALTAGFESKMDR